MEAVLRLFMLFLCIRRAFPKNSVLWIFVLTVLLVLFCVVALVRGDRQSSAAPPVQQNEQPKRVQPVLNTVWL